jgi:uncharacterized protein (TIGR00288 family)
MRKKRSTIRDNSQVPPGHEEAVQSGAQHLRGLHKIAVPIDFENTGFTGIQPLLDRLSSYGQIVLKKAYGDWSRSSSSRDLILRLGFEPVHVLRSASRRKNACDIRLTIDAIELLHKSDINAFVVVSSDSDFVPLINKLRSNGKRVYVAGEDANINDTLRISCDEYFVIEREKPLSQAADEESAEQYQKDIRPAQGESTASNKPQIGDSDAQKIDLAWAKRAPGADVTIPGPTAAAEAVAILKVQSLKKSPFKTLEGLIAANPILAEHWRRDKNTLLRK